MPKVKLTNEVVNLATCPANKKKIDLWDEVTTGFIVEIRPSGFKTYYLRYFTSTGRQKQIKIACVGDISFDQARKAAKRLRSEVVLGGDPSAKKELKKSIPTYATVAAQHLAHAKTYQRSYDSTEMIVRVHILPRWGKHRLDEVQTQDVAKWLAEKREEGLKPSSVEKIRVVFSRSFELALRWGLPGAEKNPVRAVPRPKFDNRRERFLTAEEAGRLLAAAERSPNPQLKVIVHLLLLTGARVSELLHAEWDHFDMERRLWLIPMSKTGKSRYVPLAQTAIDVIEQIPSLEGSPYLLPNPETGKPYVTLKRAWQSTRKEAKLRDLRIHDLRHSAASFMINAGIDLFAVGRVLGHADHKSTMRYSHLANDTLLAAVEAGAAKMASL